MTDPAGDDPPKRPDFPTEVGAKERRKLRARKEPDRTIWFGLGAFGLIGWSVAVPTLLGIALGAWLDRTVPVRFSWTLTLLFAGVVLGCLNAWYWMTRERTEMDRDDEGGNP